MSQHSEERASDQLTPSGATARVIPFERPQSELQKAVQQRAQERIELERDRAASQKPPAWRRALVLALAIVPVVLTFGAAIGFVGALRQFNNAVFEGAKPADTQQAPATATAPAQGPNDVVILQSYDSSGAPANSPPPVSPAPR